MSRRKREINIYRIAAEAGVSAATVSRVLNKRLGVGEETRKRITDLVTRYNFSPDYPALRTVKVAVLAPYMNYYITRAVSGIYQYAQRNNLIVNLLVRELLTKESLLETIRDQQDSGVIALMPDKYRKGLEIVSNSELPIVIVDSSSDNDRIGFIDNNSYSGSSDAVKHLLELGHSRIGYMQRDNPTLNHLQRFKGYENTMNAAGVSIEPHWINVGGELNLHEMKCFLKRAPELTAIMAVDDYMALGLMSAIHEIGLKIPEDISIVGFDNYEETAFWYPPLTTVDHPIEKAGYMAIEAIHLGLKTPGRWTPPREILPTSLIVRKSTASVGRSNYSLNR